MAEDDRDDWLWDGSGAPDPVEDRVVRALATFRYDGAPPALVGRPRRPRRAWYGFAAVGLAAVALAAVGLAAVGLAVVGLRGRGHEGVDEDLWACGDGCALGVGQWLPVGDAPVVVEVADIGTLEVAPGSRLRRVASAGPLPEHRLELTEGSVRAVVDAPPRLLVVDTPSAAAIDLGCAYTLTVVDDGESLLIVDTGLVELAGHGRTATVRAGHAALSWSGHGPGVPWSVDAPSSYADLLVAIDRDGRYDQIDALVAATVLPRDQASIDALAERLPAPERARLRVPASPQQ